MRFSDRTQSEAVSRGFSRALEQCRASGRPLLDLTVSNPTRIGLDYPTIEIQRVLADAAAVPYAPDPLGLQTARLAVAGYYLARGIEIKPDRILLTSGTSEAYSLLLKLLCNPGESVLIPKPSYPLVDVLAELEGVRAKPYPLAGEGWRWDVRSIDQEYSPGVRAVIAVSPNNPTGAMLTGEELDALSEFCGKRDLALVVDEVFLDYPAPRRSGRVLSAAQINTGLTFALSGLSKVSGMPHLKLAWIVVGGAQEAAEEALTRLEFINDAYLTVGTPVQQAAERLLALGAPVREQILRRVTQNETHLREVFASNSGSQVLPREGGWYAVVGLPRGIEDEDFALRLLAESDVIVHPGYFYDFERLQAAVISLITPPEVFREGLARMRKALGA